MAAIDTLINETGPCISIVIPTIEGAEAKNYELLKKAVQHAKGLLQNKAYTYEIKSALTVRLDETVRVLPHPVLDGLGVFVSTNQSSVLSFPFPVLHKITVDERFEQRELFYLKQFDTQYYVLSLSSREIRLYSGTMDHLEEIKNGNFPILAEQQYEYHSLTESSVKIQEAAGQDRGLTSLRQKSMFNDCDMYLEPYLSPGDGVVILAGIQKITTPFLALTRYSKKVIGKISGSFNERNSNVLQKSAWLLYVHRKMNDSERFVRQLIENDTGHLTDGIRDAWKDAHEDKAHLLAVEKNYHCRGYQRPGHNSLLLQPPSKPFTIIQDAVDELIRTVYRKKGKVVFMEDGQLKNLGHLILISQY